MALGVLFAALAALSLVSFTDWRDEVAKPIGEVADMLSKELDDRPETEGVYCFAPVET